MFFCRSGWKYLFCQKVSETKTISFFGLKVYPEQIHLIINAYFTKRQNFLPVNGLSMEEKLTLIHVQRMKDEIFKTPPIENTIDTAL